MAARRERGLFDPDAAPGDVAVRPLRLRVRAPTATSKRASATSPPRSPAVQELGNLIVIYDDNHISIEDNTRIAKSEDVGARYEAYGWHVQHVDWLTADGGYHENVQALYDAIEAAKAVTDKPSFIVLRTIIGWPAPTKQDTGAAHGSALGDAEVAATKEILGFDPAVNFPVEEEALARAREVADRGKALHAEWDAAVQGLGKAVFRTGRALRPDGHALSPGGLGGRAAGVPGRPEGHGHPQGRPARCSPRSRRCCRSCGAARPTWPSPTTPRWRASRPSSPPTARREMWPGNPYGRTLHFGIREHGMGSILNGIACARRHPALRRDVPAVQRLHARRRAAGGADGAAGHLRLDARLDRPRRGRPDPPADRAPVVAAEHPAPGRGPPGRRERDRGRLEAPILEQTDRPAGAVPAQAERADVRPGRSSRRPTAWRAAPT